MADVELKELILERLRPKKNRYDDEQRRVAVVSELQDILAEYLTDPDAELTIEVPKNLLPEIIEARESTILSSQYNIVQQETENIFKVSMKSLDLG